MFLRLFTSLACMLLAAVTAGAPAMQEETRNSIGMRLRLIPAGSFSMGADDGFPDEAPVHAVTISRPYYMGVHEVTQAQYMEVMESNPSAFRGDDLPVDSVTWADAVEFCRRLSQREGVTYRLPTEAEWEYAAKAGREDAVYAWGPYETPFANAKPQANVADLAARRVDPSLEIFPGYHDGYAYTAPVGRFPPNPFGLHDMTGNVWEWCSDFYKEDYYAASAGTDPQGPKSGEKHVFRGGSWDDGPRTARIALRGILHKKEPGNTNGFQVVREVK